MLGLAAMKKSEMLKTLIDLLVSQDTLRGEKSRYKAKRRELAEERQQRGFEAILRILPPLVEKIMPGRHDLGEPLGFELATVIRALNCSLDPGQLEEISKVLKTSQRIMMAEAARLAEKILGSAVPVTGDPETPGSSETAKVPETPKDVTFNDFREALHQKIVTFLIDELSRVEGRRCIRIKLVGTFTGLRGEILEVWDLRKHPEIFDGPDGQSLIEERTIEIIDLAEDHSHSFDSHSFDVACHYEVITEQALGGRKHLHFSLDSLE
jgi:hypothetical protein